jgi:hypothetical protein
VFKPFAQTRIVSRKGKTHHARRGNAERIAGNDGNTALDHQPLTRVRR